MSFDYLRDDDEWYISPEAERFFEPSFMDLIAEQAVAQVEIDRLERMWALPDARAT